MLRQLAKQEEERKQAEAEERARKKDLLKRAAGDAEAP